MLRRLACLSIWVLLAAVFLGEPSHAEAVTSKDGHFAATFPGAARMSSAPVQSGDVTVRMTMYAFENGVFSYYVTYSDYPPQVFARTSQGQALTNVIHSTVANVKGKVTHEETITIGNVSGREVVIDVPAQNALMRERLLLVGNRLYQIVYGGPQGSENSKAALDFLNSFRLLP